MWHPATQTPEENHQLNLVWKTLLLLLLIIIIIIIIIVFFTPALADSFSLKFELQHSPQVSRTLHCILASLIMDGLFLSFYFQILPSFFQFFQDCFKSTTYNWYHRHFHIPYSFSSLSRSRYLSLFSLSFNFILWSVGTQSPLFLFFFSK